MLTLGVQIMRMHSSRPNSQEDGESQCLWCVCGWVYCNVFILFEFALVCALIPASWVGTSLWLVDRHEKHTHCEKPTLDQNQKCAKHAPLYQISSKLLRGFHQEHVDHSNGVVAAAAVPPAWIRCHHHQDSSRWQPCPVGCRQLICHIWRAL